MGRIEGFSQDEMDNALSQIRQTCERIDAAIRDNFGPWIMGEQYTLIDVTLTPLIQRMADMDYGYLWQGDLPDMVGRFDRVRARPSFSTAFSPLSSCGTTSCSTIHRTGTTRRLSRT